MTKSERINALKSLIERNEAHVAFGIYLVSPKAVESLDGDEIAVTLEITENVGTNEQKTHTETAHFEIIDDPDGTKYRKWPRLDEIDGQDLDLEAYEWGKAVTARIKKETEV